MAESVSDILKNPFARRPRVVQQQIVSMGRAQLLKNLSMRKTTGENEDGHFRNSVLYERVPWLTRCDRRRKLFCWTCLLFMPSAAMLKSRSNADLHVVLECSRLHELTGEHMEAVLKLQIFISANFRTSVRVGDKTQHNLAVTRNREVLRRLTDAVCCAVAQKHSRGEGRYACNLLRVEDCSKFLLLLRDQDKANVDLVDGAVDMLGKYPRIVNDLVDAITRVVKTAIKDETHMSTYVSVILSEHGTTRCGKSQISTVLRYIKKGKVCERFVGFTNVLGCNTELDISSLVLTTIEQYGISDRFLALAVDGKVLPKHSLTNLIAYIKIDYHYSYFVPWHSHGFGTVLLQTLSVFDECALFLKKLDAMEIYFQNTKLRESLEVALRSKNSELRETKWHETVPFIVVVAKYRICFVEFFDSIIKNSKYWMSDDIAKAVAFRAFLQNIPSIFMLLLFSRVFSCAFDETFNFSVERQKDMRVFDNPRISNFKNHVGNLQFDTVWADLVTRVHKEGRNARVALQIDDSSAGQFDSLFQKILRHLFREIDIRCNYLTRLKFCDLLNCDPDGQFAFTPALVSLLMLEHGPFFREADMRSEVAALNSNDLFQNKCVHELLECFADLNLRNVFPQLYKLAEFTLTLPFQPASRKKGASKLKDINNCSYVPETTGIPSGEVSVLCVETEMLRDVKSSPLFYEDVLARFYEVNQTVPLVQV